MSDLAALIQKAIDAMRDTADELKRQLMPMDFTTPTIELLRVVSAALADSAYAPQADAERFR